MVEDRELVDELEADLKAIYDSMVPFRYLLKRFNETHNKGLELSE